jgi:tRNA(His) 5'-end guanylyltransferase
VDGPAVVDYFRWRQADAGRCALNGWFYWTLVKAGGSPRQANAALLGQPSDAKHELLFRHGVTFAELPVWQRRGSALYYEAYEKEGFNPRTGETVRARRRGRVESELPIGDAYAALLDDRISSTEAGPVASRN